MNSQSRPTGLPGAARAPSSAQRSPMGAAPGARRFPRLVGSCALPRQPPLCFHSPALRLFSAVSFQPGGSSVLPGMLPLTLGGLSSQFYFSVKFPLTTLPPPPLRARAHTHAVCQILCDTILILLCHIATISLYLLVFVSMSVFPWVVGVVFYIILMAWHILGA